MPYFLLTVVYIVGLFGVLWPLHEDFLLLTPLNLLFSMGVVLWHHPKRETDLVLSLLGIYLGSWLLECVGVQTGILFGNYEYGPVLGPKVLGTPLMIGVNWAMLVYGFACLQAEWRPKASWWNKASFTAMGMTLYDFLLEPVAVAKDFWTWSPAAEHWLWVAPTQNYLVWFVAAWFFAAFFERQMPAFRNPVGAYLLFLQIVFFSCIYLRILDKI